MYVSDPIYGARFQTRKSQGPAIPGFLENISPRTQSYRDAGQQSEADPIEPAWPDIVRLRPAGDRHPNLASKAVQAISADIVMLDKCRGKEAFSSPVAVPT
jgi:hypothetical protein